MNITVSNLIDRDYKDYSLYVLHQRAIPSCIDGFKPVQRKVLFAATKICKNERIKIAALGSSLAKEANYHHGEASAVNAAVKMAQDWNNQVCLIDGEGNFGSRLVQAAAAGRYIFGKLSPNFKKFFRDDEIAPKNLDLENPEPMHYLPIIPWLLVNGTSGIAIGFSCEIQPRQLKAIIKACINYLEGKKLQSLPISYPGYRGKVEKLSTGGWVSRGIYRTQGNSIIIEELPIGFDRAGYINLLNKLCDDKKIRDYQDRCSKAGFNFEVQCFSSADRDRLLENAGKQLGMEKKLNENLTVIDQNGKLKIFENELDLLKNFVDYRLTMYEERKKHQIKVLEEEVFYLKEKLHFVNKVVHAQLYQATRAELKDLVRHKPFSDDFIKIPIYNVNLEACQDLLKQIGDLNGQLAEIRNSVPKETYLRELKELQ